MDSSAGSHLLLRLLWSGDSTVQLMVGLIGVMALAALVLVHLPMWVRLAQIAVLRGSLVTATSDPQSPLERRRDGIEAAFRDSPLAEQWERFLARWQAAADAGPSGDGQRSAVRLIEVLRDHPLIPVGARRSLIPALPGLFLSLGLLGGAAALAMGPGTTAPRQIAEALPPALWGLALWIACRLGGQLLEGRSAYYARCLDELVQRGYRALSQAELATRAARAQCDTVAQLRDELEKGSRELGRALDAGLRRIEQSTAEAASLVSEEQRGSLRGVVEELRTAVRRGVDTHLGSLHQALERAVEHQDSVTGSLADNLERMRETSESNDRVAAALERAATAVDQATTSISAGASDLEPLLTHLRDTGSALERTASQIRQTQEVAAVTVDTVRSSLENAAAAVREQREFVELGLGEIRSVVEHLSHGLGEELTRALGNVDEVLGQALGRLRTTIDESNQTVDRLAGPVRAAEGVTREMHQALERVRVDVGSISQWLIQAVEPIRSTLSHLDDQTASIARALTDFGPRTETVEKTMDALRGSIGEERSHLQTASAELGQRLEKAVEAIGSLERAALEASREIAEAREQAPQERSQIASGEQPPAGPSGGGPPPQGPAGGDPPSRIPEAPDPPNALRRLGADPWARMEKERLAGEGATSPDAHRDRSDYPATRQGAAQSGISRLLQQLPGSDSGGGAERSEEALEQSAEEITYRYLFRKESS
jgi:ABC-type transporter Mla subunit MlaD